MRKIENYKPGIETFTKSQSVCQNTIGLVAQCSAHRMVLQYSQRHDDRASSSCAPHCAPHYLGRFYLFIIIFFLFLKAKIIMKREKW